MCDALVESAKTCCTVRMGTRAGEFSYRTMPVEVVAKANAVDKEAAALLVGRRGGNGRRTSRDAASFESMLPRPAPVTTLLLPLIAAGLAGVPVDDDDDDDDDDKEDDAPAAAGEPVAGGGDSGCAAAAARGAADALRRLT